jgi:hypothetical protein
MKRPLLGKLRPDPNFPEWLVSRKTPVPYFEGRKLQFILEDLATDPGLNDFRNAVAAFLHLTVDDRSLATQYVYRNCSRFVEAVGADDFDFTIDQPTQVWSYVYPEAIHVSRRYRRDEKVYVQIVANCEWEKEHGLQIVYREGKTLVRVSAQDGHLTTTDAYDLPEKQDRICY